MSDRILVVTGATSGLGLWTACQLAPHVDRVALVCRDPLRAEQARKFVHHRASRTPRVDVWLADLSSCASARAAARQMRAAYERIDILVNNAGAVFGPKQHSVDDIEMHLATNYLGHFVLTALLLDRMAAAPGSRVINLTSALHAVGRIRLHDPRFERWYHLVRAYANSKLAIVLFTRELARRVSRLSVAVNCVDPGLVRTPIWHGAGPIQRQFARPLQWFAKDPCEGAMPITELATSPEFKGCTGEYFVRTRRRQLGRRARDEASAAALWDWSCGWLEENERAALQVLIGLQPPSRRSATSASSVDATASRAPAPDHSA